MHALVDNVRKFRNRLAHNEPVFSTKTGLVKRMEEVETLFRFLRPEAAQWVREHSDVPRLIARCPVPGLMPATGRAWPMNAAQAAAMSFARPLAGCARRGRLGRWLVRLSGRNRLG